MRVTTLVLATLLITPIASALLPALPAQDAVVDLRADLRDGDLLLLMARHQGLEPERLAPPVSPAGLTLSEMTLRLAARAGASLSPHDASIFNAVDPRVAAPTLVMLLAIEQAWILRDQAFAGVSEEELREWQELRLAGIDPPGTLNPEQKELLITAAMLLSDTLDSVVIPALETLGDTPTAWPPIAIADPAGILRIGSNGNDFATVDRILQIDGHGNDLYRNNAGGTTILKDLDPTTIDTPISISLDLHGDDVYEHLRTGRAQGSGSTGIGMLYDLRGNDRYDCLLGCQGSGSLGIGLLRDTQGDDTYRYPDNGMGYGNTLYGVLRDDTGNDQYWPAGVSGGMGDNEGGIGLYWDRAGQDHRVSVLGDSRLWGYARTGGEGWFVDEGSETDTYDDIANHFPHPKACNDCTWTAGAQNRGLANDNSGGLSFLYVHQRA